MIVTEKISKQFNGVPAVNAISFTVEEGETLVLLGTSGCGKTTTLKMLNRLIEPTSGTIKINGKNILQQQPEVLRRDIGYVLQNHGLFPHYTVEENIAIVPKLLGWQASTISNRITELMSKLQLPASLLKVYPASLSGGQQQRVGLARALAVSPSILLMDEPFGALDPITRAGIRQEFKQLDELKRKTIVLVTHDVEEAFALGDRICLMDKGVIMQIDKPEALLLHPANKYVYDFFDGQRLQLELKSLKLASIFNQMPLLDYNDEPLLSTEDSVWQALQAFSKGAKKVGVYDEDKNHIKALEFGMLQKFFLTANTVSHG